MSETPNEADYAQLAAETHDAGLAAVMGALQAGPAIAGLVGWLTLRRRRRTLGAALRLEPPLLIPPAPILEPEPITPRDVAVSKVGIDPNRGDGFPDSLPVDFDRPVCATPSPEHDVYGLLSCVLDSPHEGLHLARPSGAPVHVLWNDATDTEPATFLVRHDA